MKLRTKLLLTTAASALLLGGTSGTQVMAADAMVVKAAPAPAGWWYQGYIEVGARFYGPQHTGGTTPGGANLAKFNEYRDLRPGPFGNIFMATGSNDGLYVVDFWAKNIGYDDQSYYLNFSKAGEHYLTLGWDETPHNYGTSVATIFGGVGTNSLTVPAGVRAAIAAGYVAPYSGVAAAIANNSNTFALGFRRDTGSVDYRWTPTTNWDVKVDYSHTHREGTQAQSAVTTSSGSYAGAPSKISVELPKPIDDTTQNGNFSAEYAGVSPWGKKFNVAFAYGFSIYEQGNDVVYFQNPFQPDGAPPLGNTATASLTNALALPPSNNANIFTLNGGADLPGPWKSRDTFTAQYTNMAQNTAFSNYGIAGNPFTVNPAAPVPTISAASLDANNGVTLINNTLTTQFTPDLKSVLKYRFYDITSNANAVTVSTILPQGAAIDTPVIRTYDPFNYQKQNANGDLVWNPLRWLTFGTGAGWERWNRDHRDVNVTDEYTGKVFVDAKAWDWGQMRSSLQYGERRFDTYARIDSQAYNQYYRGFDMANRNRTKGTFSFDIYAPNNFVITPTGGFRWDDYGTNANRNPNFPTQVVELGLLSDHKWNAGLELSWGFARNINLIASYVHEEGFRRQMQNSATSPADVHIEDRIDTFMVGANAVLIPERLNLKATYTYVQAVGATMSIPGPVGTTTASMPLGPSTINFNRVDTVAKYQFNPDWVHSMGWKGEVYATLRYLWESNSVVDPSLVTTQYLYMMPGLPGAAAAPRSIFLGWDNPNYNVHLVAASVGFKW